MQMDFDKALKGHSLDRLEEGIYFERLGVCHESEEKIDEEAFLLEPRGRMQNAGISIGR